jgi:lipid A oxidase
MLAILKAVALLIFTATAVHAQAELSFYGGRQTVANSAVSGNEPGGLGAFDFLAKWEDIATDPRSRFGLRLTWWQNETLGWGVDFDQMPVRADTVTLAANGLSELEFGNGSSQLTLNAYRRWYDGATLVPYVGAGIGVAIPRVGFDAGSGRTSQLQLSGPVVQWLAGASYPLGGRWSVFGEYKGSFSANRAKLNGGGVLNTNILQGALNVGMSLGF